MTESRKTLLLSLLVLLLGASLVGNVILYTDRASLGEEKLSLFEERNVFLLERASTTAALETASTTIATLTLELERLDEEYDELSDELYDEKSRNEKFEDQIKDIAGTVGVLDKLSKTDEELLQKYSKVYFLNENYIPSKIKQIDDRYILGSRDAQFFHADALPFLTDMIEEAAEDGITLKVISAYRSFDTQAELKSTFTQIYGTGANTFSADQGYSEHQLGTAVDLTDPTTGGTYTSFKDTPAYAWLLENAHRYGFTLSYPENNNFYIFEPWHWRFVGKDLARDLKREGAHFYDWDQRRIDEYLVSIFD